MERDDVSPPVRRRKYQDTHRQASRNGSTTAPPPSTPPPSTTVSLLSTFLPTLTLIFFGCCSNVYTLESLIQTSPNTGPLLTFAQFLLVSLFSSRSILRLTRSPPYITLTPRSIPLTKWIVYTLYFLTINLLNNHAFRYSISVPLHIILRSAGPVTSMLVSSTFGGRTYPRLKQFSVILLFAGVVVAALSDSYAKSPKTLNLDTTTITPSSTAALKAQAPGFLLLFLALLLSAFLGLYTDKLYATYGRSADVTTESLFYSHTISLPFFALQYTTLWDNLMVLATTSPPLSTTLALNATTLGPTSILHQLLASTPTALVMLLLNAATQCVCISGVNSLAAKSSSLTVSIVLNVRKLVSLLLSIYLFGNRLHPGVVAGAALVFLGGGLYAWPSGKKSKGQEAKQSNGTVGNIQGKKEL